MVLIKFNAYDGNAVFFNPERIVKLVVGRNGGTMIYSESGFQAVKERLEDVISKLQGHRT